MPRSRISDKQLAANRANAAKSTGPRTPEGKARSAQNARKHGFTASTFAVVRLEDLQEVAHLKADLVACYQPVNTQELFAIERMALSQQAILRASRLEVGMFTTCLDETLDREGQAMLIMHPDLIGNGDIEITRAQNRNYLLGSGFHRMAQRSNAWSLFLRYQAQAERHYRRAVEEFERLRALRPELPNEPIVEPQPEENELVSPPPADPIPPDDCDIMQSMTRRELLAGALTAAVLPARTIIDRSSISAISDEIGRTPQASIDFARKYNLQFLELRNVPGGKEYSFLPEDEVRQAAADFERNGIRISFMNSSLLKYAWPGTDPVRKRPESDHARFDRRMDELHTAIRNSQILGCGLLRVFTGSRVAEPEKLHQRIADVIGEMSLVAEKEHIQLLIENEGSCNIATSAELASLLKLIPSRWVAINWDSLNGVSQHENPFPEGYQVLPKDRIRNVQIKGKTLLDYPEKLDWKTIFRTLQADGYTGKLGLETHIFGEGQIQASHDSMREILRIVGEL